MESLFNQLPGSENSEKCLQWWAENKKDWSECLRQAMIGHRNIGHDWQFTDEQKALLKQYKNANDLLLERLERECYIDRPIREKIENELFLPQSRL